MTPADVRELLDGATPAPWRTDQDHNGAPRIADSNHYLFAKLASHTDSKCIVALRNLAPLLVELWEQTHIAMINAEIGPDHSGTWDGAVDTFCVPLDDVAACTAILDKLAEFQP